LQLVPLALILSDEGSQHAWIKQLAFEPFKHSGFEVFAFDQETVVTGTLVAGGSAAVFGFVHEGV